MSLARGLLNRVRSDTFLHQPGPNHLVERESNANPSESSSIEWLVEGAETPVIVCREPYDFGAEDEDAWLPYAA